MPAKRWHRLNTYWTLNQPVFSDVFAIASTIWVMSMTLGAWGKIVEFFQNGQTEETDPGGAWNVRQSVPESPEVSHKCQRSEISTRVKATSVLKVKLELMWRSLTAWRALKSLFLQTRTSEQKKWCIWTLQHSCSHKRRRCSQHDVDKAKQGLHCLETQQGINTPTARDIQKYFFSDSPFLTRGCLQHIQHLTR